MTSLGPALAKLEGLLIAANGDFVAGQILASACGVPMITLSNFIGQLRAKRPALHVEGKRGKGYRAVGAPAPAETPAPATAAKKSKAASRPPAVPPVAESCLTSNQRTVAATSLLDMLRPKSAELVKTIALESGESAESCLARLIAYGAEVHHALVGEGENPVGLVTPRETQAATRH